MKRAVVITLFLAAAGFFPVWGPTPVWGSGGPQTVVLVDEATSSGHLRVLGRVWDAEDHTIVSGVFFSPQGQVVTFLWDSWLPEEVRAGFPWGAMVSRRLGPAEVEVRIESPQGLLWRGVVATDGSFVLGTQGDFLSAIAAFAGANADVVGALTAHSLESEMVEPAPNFGCYTLGKRAVRNINCAASAIGLVASYPALFACATVIGCPLAVGAHAAAVVGFVTSCF